MHQQKLFIVCSSFASGAVCPEPQVQGQTPSLYLQLLWAVPSVLQLILIFTRAAFGLACSFYHIKSSHFHLPCIVAVFHTELFYIKHLKPFAFQNQPRHSLPFSFLIMNIFSWLFTHQVGKGQGKTSKLQTNTYPTDHDYFQYFPTSLWFTSSKWFWSAFEMQETSNWQTREWI